METFGKKIYSLLPKITDLSRQLYWSFRPLEPFSAPLGKELVRLTLQARLSSGL